MVNQDPQPEIFQTVHEFDYTGGNIAANTMRAVDVFTYQANNEEFRLYALKVELLGLVDYGGAVSTEYVELDCCNVLPGDTAGATTIADAVYSPQNTSAPSWGGMDFNIGIRVGGQLVPSTTFDASTIFCRDDQTLALACPVIVLFKQPFQIEVTNATQLTQLATYGKRKVRITLIGELGIQKQY